VEQIGVLGSEEMCRRLTFQEPQDFGISHEKIGYGDDGNFAMGYGTQGSEYSDTSSNASVTTTTTTSSSSLIDNFAVGFTVAEESPTSPYDNPTRELSQSGQYTGIETYIGNEVQIEDTRVITGFGLDITPSGCVKVGAKKRSYLNESTSVLADRPKTSPGSISQDHN
jgi:hypothetical protein